MFVIKHYATVLHAGQRVLLAEYGPYAASTPREAREAFEAEYAGDVDPGTFLTVAGSP